MDKKKICFADLSLEEKIKHFYSVAERALEKWGYPKTSELKLVNYTENATFCVVVSDKEKYIMRVHRLDYAELNDIKTEMSWLQALIKETDLNITTPIASRNGLFVETIITEEMKEARNVVCFEFVDGKAPMDSSEDLESVMKLVTKFKNIPDVISTKIFKAVAALSIFVGKVNKTCTLTEADRRMYRELGKIAGKIHNQSMNWNSPEFYSRMEWDFEGTFGEGWNNFYGADYHEVKCLSKRDIIFLEQCVNIIKVRLENYGKGSDRYGMIHSDLRAANLLKNGEKYTVLDFDDCGRGWYMYDIAGIVAIMEHRADIKDILNEIITGYETVRYISDADKNEIETFTMIRRIGILQSLNFRIGNVVAGQNETADLTPETFAFYAKGTAILARDYVRKHQYSLEIASKAQVEI